MAGRQARSVRVAPSARRRRLSAADLEALARVGTRPPRRSAHRAHDRRDSRSTASRLRNIFGRCTCRSFCLRFAEGRNFLSGSTVRGRLRCMIFPTAMCLSTVRCRGSRTRRGSGRYRHTDSTSSSSAAARPLATVSSKIGTLVLDDGIGKATSSSLIRRTTSASPAVRRRSPRRRRREHLVLDEVRSHAEGIVAPRGGPDLRAPFRSPQRARHHDPGDDRDYRRLGIPRLEEMNSSGVFYSGPSLGGSPDRGHRRVRPGGQLAGQAALPPGTLRRRVTLVVRAQSLA